MVRIKPIYKMVLLILLVLLSPFIALGLIRFKIDYDKARLTAETYEIAQMFGYTPERFLSEQPRCTDFYISANCSFVIAFNTKLSNQELLAIAEASKEGYLTGSLASKNEFIYILSSRGNVYVDDVLAYNIIDQLPLVPSYGIVFRTKNHIINCQLYHLTQSPTQYLFQKKSLQQDILTIMVTPRKS